MEIAAPPEATQHGRKLTAAEKKEILRLYDKPYALGEIGKQLNLPVAVVREALRKMVPVDAQWVDL